MVLWWWDPVECDNDKMDSGRPSFFAIIENISSSKSAFN